MKTKITKLDRRYSGNEYFKYSLPGPGNEYFNYMAVVKGFSGGVNAIDHFRNLRQWCWETFGPSCELSEYTILASNDKPVNERWCWVNETPYRCPRILIKNEEDRNWFVLRWG